MRKFGRLKVVKDNGQTKKDKKKLTVRLLFKQVRKNMSITPQEISDKAFSRTFRGYNQEEVDLFLDKIYFELEEMIRYKDETELYIKKTRRASFLLYE